MALVALSFAAVGVVVWFLPLFLGVYLGALTNVLALICPGVAIACGYIARSNPRTTRAGAAMAQAGLIIGIVQYAMVAMLFILLSLILMSCGTRKSASGSGCGCPCTDACAACGDGCASCGKGCGAGCSSCGDGCSSCGEGCSSCGSCGSGCSCGTLACPAHVLIALPAPLPSLRLDLAHHPDTPAYRADVFRLGGLRLCVGCFVTFPVFFAAILALTLAGAAAPWFLTLGLALASLQVFSSLGLARWRWAKVLVKVGLGMGLALAVRGVLSSSWSPQLQALVLLGILGLAQLSTVPRARRMAAAQVLAPLSPGPSS